MNLSSVVFKSPLPTLDELESKYPNRGLTDNTIVTRVAPSPTGFMHIGTVYMALISKKLAKQTDGFFFLRIEDTDKKREVEGAAKFIIDALNEFGIAFDEGMQADGSESGAYGPYVQSERREIYHGAVKHLLDNDLAYVCFATPEQLEEMREKQAAKKVLPGYYGDWAIYRDNPIEDTLKRIENGESYVVRFKSPGDPDKRIKVYDKIAGELELPENIEDIVIMKSDGLPTYHMAHVVDDHFMRTTHVTRGNEWIASLPKHVQMFEAFGWKAPKFAHVMPIYKNDGGSKRKLSKRKDPESNVSYFSEKGYPTEAILEYLMNLANSKFEPWREQKPEASLDDFEMTFKGLAASSGPLFDFDKLNDISKNIISRLSAEELYDRLLTWATQYDHEFASLMTARKDYVTQILSIERGGKKSRKDNASYSEFKDDMAYFFDDQFDLNKEGFLELIAPVSKEDAQAVIAKYIETYDHAADKETWFNTIRGFAEELGFAVQMKEYKSNPENFKGSIADLVKVIRVLVTGRINSPDLHAINQVMGKEMMLSRLKQFD